MVQAEFSNIRDTVKKLRKTKIIANDEKARNKDKDKDENKGDDTQEQKSLKMQNKILKEELMKYKAESESKSKQIQDIAEQIHKATYPVNFREGVSTEESKTSAYEAIDSEKVHSLLVWNLGFGLSLNSVVLDYLDGIEATTHQKATGAQHEQKALGHTSQKTRYHKRSGLKLLKQLLDGVKKAKPDNVTIDNKESRKENRIAIEWKDFDSLIADLNEYIGNAAETELRDIILKGSVGEFEIQHEIMAKLLNEYGKLSENRRLQDSAWNLFYKQNQLSSEVNANVMFHTWSILKNVFVFPSGKKFSKETTTRNFERNVDEKYENTENRSFINEVNEVNTSFKDILSEYSGRKIDLDRNRDLELDIHNSSTMEGNWRIVLEESQTLKGQNRELKEKLKFLEKKNKENEAYLRESLITVMQYVMQASHSELIITELQEREINSLRRIESLETIIADYTRPADPKDAQSVPTKTEHILRKENTHLRQLNLALGIEKKELKRMNEKIQEKLESKQAKCKFLKASIVEISNVDKDSVNLDLHARNDPYMYILQRLMNMEKRYITTFKLLKNVSEASNKVESSKIIHEAFLKLIEELEEENKS